MDKCVICGKRKWIGKFKDGKCGDCKQHDEVLFNPRYIVYDSSTNLLNNSYDTVDNSHCDGKHNHTSSSHDSHYSCDSSSDSSCDCSCDCGGCD